MHFSPMEHSLPKKLKIMNTGRVNTWKQGNLRIKLLLQAYFFFIMHMC